MDLNQLYKEWFDIVDASREQLTAAQQHAFALKESCEEEKDHEEADKLLLLLEKRVEQVDRISTSFHNKIKELALLMHHWKE